MVNLKQAEPIHQPSLKHACAIGILVASIFGMANREGIFLN
jgi:hypothetical protein